MFENGFLEKLEPGAYESLEAIHNYLFDEIYDFAGKIREVNLSKGNFRFAPLMYLKAALQSIDKMPQSTFDEIIEKICGNECSPSIQGRQWKKYKNLA